MENIVSNLHGHSLAGSYYGLYPFGQTPNYEASASMMRGPTKRERTSVLSYLSKINRAVNEQEISEALDLDRLVILPAIVEDFRKEGYVRVVKTPLILPKNATMPQRIGAALSYSAKGEWYEIAKKGKEQLKTL